MSVDRKQYYQHADSDRVRTWSLSVASALIEAVMNPTPSSTQFSVPQLGNSQSGATPAEFLEFLRSLPLQYLGDNCRRIPASDKLTWITIVNGLTDHFLGPFPLPGVVLWNAMQEKGEMIEGTLEVVRRVFLRVDTIYNDSLELVRKLFVRLLDLCRTMDVWMGTPVQDAIDNQITPLTLRGRALSVLVSVLRGLGSNNPLPSGQQPSWMILRDVLKAGLEFCRGKSCSSLILP